MPTSVDKIPDVKIWQCSEEDAYRALDTSPAGLTTNEALRRLQQYGPNRLPARAGRPIIFRFFQQFTDLFAVLLEVAAALTFFAAFLSPDVGARADNLNVAFAIVGVVFLNATIGFFQEYRAEKATEALQKLVPANAKVMRNGELTIIPATELVPGDVMVLEEGDAISADARLVRQFEMATNNIALTGESDPVRKTSDPITEEKLAKIDMPNLIFMGTSVAAGNGRGIVFAAGMNTEFGRIFELTTGVREEKSPLQKEIGVMARTVSFIAIITGAALFVMGQYLRLNLVGAVLFGLGVMVACVPEGLPATLSVALAVGVQRMARENALIKKLSAVETLGSTNVIATDKTGTLTKAEMTVKQMYVGMTAIDVTGAGYEPVGEFEIKGRRLSKDEVRDKLIEFFRAITFCNNSKVLPPSEDKGWRVIGDPTEGCLIVVAQKGGFDLNKELMTHPRIYELPFDSVRKRMAVINVEEEGQRAYVKGAPSETIPRCTRVRINGKDAPLTDDLRDIITGQNDAMSREALRVLAVAERDLPNDMTDYSAETVENDLTFLGLAGMIDPPRPEVTDAVVEATTAGIRIIMVTGDYGLTAEAIARKIGIVKGRDVRVIAGVQLDQMSDTDLEQELREHYYIVFARVSPEHKMRVVSALKRLDLIVAVTGDGVNDAPALKRADIGVAMGITGTDVSREAAVMILLDDSFASIIKAVEQGRGVYSNLKKMVTYLFSHNAGELFPFIFATLAQVHLVPLTALQVLSIDLASDVLPALALGTERPEPGTMQRPPRPRTSRVLDKATLKRIAFIRSIQSAWAVGGFLWVLLSHGWTWGNGSWSAPGNPHYPIYREAITMTQGAIIMSQFANGFVTRSERASIFQIGLFSNLGVLFGEIVGLLIFIGISYWGPLQYVFKTGPLSWADWGILIAASLTLFIAEETRKWLVRRRERHQEEGA